MRETFRLDLDCLGIIWSINDGWFGCLHWDGDDVVETDRIGPFTCITAARMAVRAQFILWTLAQAEEEHSEEITTR